MVKIPSIKVVMTGGWFVIVLPTLLALEIFTRTPQFLWTLKETRNCQDGTFYFLWTQLGAKAIALKKYHISVR